jgi:hypothetical protein
MLCKMETLTFDSSKHNTMQNNTKSKEQTFKSQISRWLIYTLQTLISEISTLISVQQGCHEHKMSDFCSHSQLHTGCSLIRQRLYIDCTVKRACLDVAYVESI